MQGSFTSQSSMVCRRERRVDCRGGWSMWGLVIYRAPSPLNGVSRVLGVTWLVLANHILVSSATLARCKLFNLGLNVVTDLCINSRIWDLFIQECCQPWIKKHAGAGNSCRVALPRNIPLMMHFMWLPLHCHLMSKCGYILFEIKVTGQLLLTMWFCCKSKCEHMDWFGINWQGDHWVHYMDHIPIMVQKTFNCPYFVAYFPIVLYFYMPLWILQSIISSPLLLSLCNKALLLRAVLKRVPTFEGTFLTLWVAIYFSCHKQWLWKGPQLRTWSSWGPNCWNGPHLVLILHKVPHFPCSPYVLHLCYISRLESATLPLNSIF